MAFLVGLLVFFVVRLLDIQRDGRKYCLSRVGAVLWAAIILVGGTLFLLQPTMMIAAGLLFVGLVSLSLAITLAVFSGGWLRLAAGIGISLVLGFGVVGIAEIIGRFSEEEFFVGVQAAILSCWCFIVWALSAWAHKRRWSLKIRQVGGSFAMRLPGWLALFPLIFAVLFLVQLVTQYQGSFYPLTEPVYPQITEENPFLCGQIADPSPSVYEGSQVYAQLLEQSANSSIHGPSEQGMLAVLTTDPRWPEAFRQSLLQEAKEGKFTGPANSVKYGQYEAAQRLYYYAALNAKAPDLFTQAEREALADWFAAINRRTMTVEWVDWMYALAFGEWPRGPYLNQEIGAGLLSLLQLHGLADPLLSEQNREFLAAHPFGWQKGFRNTDDALSYQLVWINNALFQSMVSPQLSSDEQYARRIQAAFDWLLLQALPDGNLTGYNPHPSSLASISYLGAALTGSADLLWLAGRSLDYARSNQMDLLAQPGISGAVDFTGRAPQQGSCLLYADSGLPNKASPLAPDKIVFRSGWDQEDSYLMLNLRFTGWHRYKATNSIVSIYQQEPWIIEKFDGESANWLPVGRSQFRDKRVPRENLNGLVIGRSGLDRLLHALTGFGGVWAQDVPYYASVARFQTGPDRDESVTTLNNWNGWTHTRKITFIHDGPIVVFDEAAGPGEQAAGITWHAIVPDASTTFADDRLRVGPSGMAEMRLLYINGKVTAAHETAAGEEGMGLLYTSGDQGSLRLVTVFLSQGWDGAQVNLLDPEKMTVSILHNDQELLLSFAE